MSKRPSSADVRVLEDRLGYTFRDRSLLEAAVTHASALPAAAVRVGERLEFLGDAVLALAVAELLLDAFPAFDEGELSKLRASLVRTRTLAAKAREVGLDEAIRLGRGEERSGGRTKISILAAAYEAVLGAVFHDGGYAAVRAVIARHFRDEIGGGKEVEEQDWKTLLQERIQAGLRVLPEYRVARERGPAHARRFTLEVWVAGRRLARGEGSSKREAEQQAARAALALLPDVGLAASARAEPRARVAGAEPGHPREDQ
jgi:ribonuclease-3